MPQPLNFRRTRESIPFGRLHDSCASMSAASVPSHSLCRRILPAQHCHLQGCQRFASPWSRPRLLTGTETFVSDWCRLNLPLCLCSTFTFFRGCTMLGPCNVHRCPLTLLQVGMCCAGTRHEQYHSRSGRALAATAPQYARVRSHMKARQTPRQRPCRLRDCSLRNVQQAPQRLAREKPSEVTAHL